MTNNPLTTNWSDLYRAELLIKVAEAAKGTYANVSGEVWATRMKEIMAGSLEAAQKLLKENE